MAVCVVLLAVARSSAEEMPFAASVVEYAPAPGQFVNDPFFNDPAKALGPPRGGGTGDGNDLDVVTLGGFGGVLVLGFDHTVIDDRLNPLGMDAIVFGNAFWIGADPQLHWAECATIEISLDANGNGLPDDPWYLIPGLHIPDPQAQLTSIVWDDDVGDATYPPRDEYWIPGGRYGQWSTAAYQLPVSLFGVDRVRNPSTDTLIEGIFGYADYSPTLVLGDLDGDNIVDDPSITPDQFYIVPDDPLAVGITAGSGGGDAFDIAWSIDPVSGQPAGLSGFDFIRLTTAVHSIHPLFGEKSAEIDAVADVAPDPFGDGDADGDIDLFDVALFLHCMSRSDFFADQESLCAQFDRASDGTIDLSDFGKIIPRMTGPT